MSAVRPSRWRTSTPSPPAASTSPAPRRSCRLAMMQRERDLAAGLNTARLHLRLSRLAARRLRPGAVEGEQAPRRTHHVHFQPGVNEELAATAVWGTQQVGLFPGAKYDGVFAMWYGKGPGVDRCGDVFKHANAAGTSQHGGVLLVAGDDHGAASRRRCRTRASTRSTRR